MKVWTIQPKEIIQKVKNGETFYCDPKQAFWKDEFQDAYQWMAEQMKKKIGEPPRKGIYPVWVWYSWEGKRKCPLLQEDKIKRNCEILELDIPENKILLSDFDNWFFVLNHLYLSMKESRKEQMKECDSIYCLPEEEKQKQIEKSWEHIFQTEHFNNGYLVTGEYVQGCVWCLKPEYIVENEKTQQNHDEIRALSVAEYIITRCLELKKPVSNMQLQKMLYRVQEYFLGNECVPLYKDKIIARVFGPCISEVYKRYCGHGAVPITVKYKEVILPAKITEKINKVIQETIDLEPWEFCDLIMGKYSAWDLIYKNGEGACDEIPIELILERAFVK